MGSFSLVHWIILAITVLIFASAVKGLASAFRSGATLFCTTCGSQSPTKAVTRGSIWIELILWLCLIVPGLIYSIWRMTNRVSVCAACGATTVVPVDSPVALKMRKDLDRLAGQ